MALIAVDDVKDYLRIQHSAEDTMLEAWRLQAVAAVEAEIGRPITVLLRTFTLECPEFATSASKLFVPLYPIAVTDSGLSTADLVLVDGNDATLVEGIDYRLDVRTGIIRPITGSFATFPYTVTAYVGLQALDEYDARIEPVLNAAILDVVADRYQRRNPAATSEDSSNVSAGYTTSNPGLPQRVRDLLAPWRIFQIAA